MSPRTRVVKVMPMSSWMQLPPAKHLCQICAGDHAPEEPHNPDSMHWQVARQIAEEPPPTWKDALEHVEPGLRARWVEALAEHGVTVDA